MANKRKRRPNGAAWFRKYDNSWYFTPKGGKSTKLLGEQGHPIRGKSNRDEAELALARLKLHGQQKSEQEEWLVGTVCQKYTDHQQRLTDRGQRSVA